MEFTEIRNYLLTSLSNISNYGYLETTINEMEIKARNHNNFNYEELLEEIIRKNVAYMNSPVNYLRKGFFAMIDSGKFDNASHKRDLRYLASVILRKVWLAKGYEYDELLDVTINHYFEYFEIHKLLTTERQKEWINKAFSYLETNNKKTMKDFLWLFKNTKLMRALRLPHEQIEKESKEILEDYQKILGDLKQYDKK